MNLFERVKELAKKLGKIFIQDGTSAYNDNEKKTFPPKETLRTKCKLSEPKKKPKSFRGPLHPRKAKNLVSIFIIFFTGLLLSGCSKNQDVKIVHNYWDKTPSYQDRKKQLHLDMYVYKKFNDANGKECCTIYKAD